MKLFDKKDKQEKTAVVEAEAGPTPLQSLDVLSELCGRVALDRQNHTLVINHVENIRKALA